MMRLSIDIETYSSADITKTGAYAYAEAPDFEILLIGYQFDDMPKPSVIETAGMTKEEAVWYVQEEYSRLYSALHDPDILKTAFNANFERTCLTKYFDYMKPEQWQCTMIRSAMLGLPMSLAGVGSALGLDDDKQKLSTGKALIQYFSKPCKPTKSNGGRRRNLPEHAPEKWRLFVEYNLQDVVAERAILEKLDAYGPMSPSEKNLWCWDQRTNDHGVLLDIPYIEGILEYDARRTKELTEEAVRLTGLQNPNSVSQLKSWLAEQGVEMDGVTKETVSAALKGDIPMKVRRVLEIRQALGKTSTKKYQAMVQAVCADGRLRGILQFYGANRTGRWAGRIVQTHNLPQNHLDDIEYCRELVAKKDFEAVEMIYGETAFVFSQLVRTAFIASPGCRFVVCDFSAVEARILGWLAGEQWRMDVFKNGGDIYCESASQMYHVPVVKHGVNGHLRQRGKVAELALGYQGGVGAMKRMDTTGSIPEEEMQGIVDQWREASPQIVSLWRDMELAAKKAIAEMRPETRPVHVGGTGGARHKYRVIWRDECGSVHEAGETVAVSEDQAINNVRHNIEGDVPTNWMYEAIDLNKKKRGARISFYMKGGALFMVLPSGRKLCYWDTKVVHMEDGRDHITYAGMDQETKRWTRSETYGGKLVENCVQAIGRDCLAEAMLRVARMGYQIVMHVHDEMIVDVPCEDKDAYRKISEAMGQSPAWAPGLVLRGDGYETEFYKKD